MTKRQVRARRAAIATAPPPEEPGPRNPFVAPPYEEPRALTEEQVEQVVVAEVLEGESAAAAGRIAGVEHGTAIAARPHVRSALVEALERQGVDDSLLARTLRKGLKAKQRSITYKDGSVSPACADHSTRHKFLTTCLRVRGDLREDAAAGGDDTWEATIIRLRHTRHGGAAPSTE